jgi:hypothetical protein
MLLKEHEEENETIDKDWEWWLKITRINNGFLVEHEGEFGGKVKFAITEPEHHCKKLDPELQALGELAQYIWNHFGHYYSKHEPENLRVAVERGHGREDFDGNLVNMWEWNKREEKDDG